MPYLILASCLVKAYKHELLAFNASRVDQTINPFSASNSDLNHSLSITHVSSHQLSHRCLLFSTPAVQETRSSSADPESLLAIQQSSLFSTSSRGTFLVRTETSRCSCTSVVSIGKHLSRSLCLRHYQTQTALDTPVALASLVSRYFPCSTYKGPHNANAL